ncbi:hypothetical protein K933_15992 [Candidatus Halobonum tyrrellensis G22]|uniref:DUF7577 domain-containing protein n=1 Tax=Candidatus Halobonum tyrrellensis G22 TaxID=1324957 RepID=V4GNR8_9EURY|nr:hypothetical protein K933_15992 [Candidatus Halobonum tyrrellensis G22]
MLYGVGLACYLLGTAAACLLTVELLFRAGGLPERLPTSYLLSVAASLGILLSGRLLLGRAGDDRTGRAGLPGPPQRRPEPSTLERLGYRVPPDSSDPADGADERSGGDRAAVACPDCGARNEPGFDYCRNCSAQLPDPG